MTNEGTGNSSHGERNPEEVADPQRVSAGQMSSWTVDTLPLPPMARFSLRRILGPGLLMVGLAIGGGEWLTGPALTAQYGGTLMWIATISILLQSAYNLEVMRYTLYCGEPIMVGFFRVRPGPRFWTWVYMVIDVGAIWPFLAANAAVPLAAAFLGHLPATLPTTYLSVQEVIVETGLPKSVVQEMSDHPERFGMLRQLQLQPEQLGNTQRWRPFPSPLTEWVEGESIESVVQRTGLSWEVVEQIHATPELFGPMEEVTRKTGLPSDLVRKMAEHPEQYRTSLHWKPIPQIVLDRWISPERSTLRWLAYVVFISAALPLIFGGKIYNIVECRQDDPGPRLPDISRCLLCEVGGLDRDLLGVCQIRRPPHRQRATHQLVAALQRNLRNWRSGSGSGRRTAGNVCRHRRQWWHGKCDFFELCSRQGLGNGATGGSHRQCCRWEKNCTVTSRQGVPSHPGNKEALAGMAERDNP